MILPLPDRAPLDLPVAALGGPAAKRLDGAAALFNAVGARIAGAFGRAPIADGIAVVTGGSFDRASRARLDFADTRDLAFDLLARLGARGAIGAASSGPLGTVRPVRTAGAIVGAVGTVLACLAGIAAAAIVRGRDGWRCNTDKQRGK